MDIVKSKYFLRINNRLFSSSCVFGAEVVVIMHTAHLGGNKRRTVVWHQLVTFIWNYKILKFKELKETSQAQGREARAGKKIKVTSIFSLVFASRLNNEQIIFYNLS